MTNYENIRCKDCGQAYYAFRGMIRGVNKYSCPECGEAVEERVLEQASGSDKFIRAYSQKTYVSEGSTKDIRRKKDKNRRGMTYDEQELLNEAEDAGELLSNLFEEDNDGSVEVYD